MKQLLLIAIVLGLGATSIDAQKLLCRDGHVWFFSSTPMEDIEAHNKQASSIIDTESGDVVVQVLMKSFEFEKALMQEHFNENYVESDKFPKGKFKGKINNLSEINFTKDGTYTAIVEGVLNIHGVDKDVSTQATFTIVENKVRVQGKFVTSPSDFEIEIPAVVRDNIAKQMDVNFDMEFSALKK